MLDHQPFAQSTLQQAEAKDRFLDRQIGVGQPSARPLTLNLANALNHHFIIIAVRASVERQAQPNGGILAAGQQNPIGPEIIKANIGFAYRGEHLSEICAF